MSSGETASGQDRQIVESCPVRNTPTGERRPNLPRKVLPSVLCWLGRIALLPFRLLALFVVALVRAWGINIGSGIDPYQTGNVYDPLFAARIAALVPPQPAPPPDYSKQKLRTRNVALVGVVLLVVIG